MRNFYRNYKAVRILVKILIILIILFLAVIIFVRLHPVFGSIPEKADRENYTKRAEGYFDGTKFSYPSDWELTGVDENKQISIKETAPKDELPVETPDFALCNDGGVTITWFGHASSLIQMSGKNILIDPLFSKRSSPFQWIGPARFTEPSVTVDDLPHIDAVLITHNHYDHLDMGTIKALESKTDRYIVPLGVEQTIKRWIEDDSKVTELAWWENADLDGMEIHCTPSNHKSGRAFQDQQRSLFCSWVLKDNNHQILQSSDTGYGAHFEEIHKRFGDFDLFLPDSGQYNINWHYWHMFPEESVLAAETLGAKAVMPIHWGAFILSNHGWDDSPERVTLGCEEKGIEVISPKLCETMVLDKAVNYHERWWREYN